MTDPIVQAARFLATQLEYSRHQPWVDEFFSDLRECASKLRFTTDGPAARKYLGPCGAPVPQPPEGEPDLPCCVATQCEPHGGPCCVHGEPVNCPADPYVDRVPCEGDVYGRAGAKTGTCRTCKAEYDQAERQIWLTEQVRSSDLAWTARGIADALGINVKTVRAWATDRYSGDVLIRRAKLSTYWRDEQGRLVPWSEVARGERLHYVGDVKALAEQAADRRAAREAAERGELAA